MRRRWLIASAIALALLSWLWLRRERAWTVTLVPAAATTAPWAAVTLVARVTPAPADQRDWSWKWTARSGDVDADGSTAKFSAGTAGAHRVRVTVRSPRGTEQSAEAVVTVKVSEFLIGLGRPMVVSRPEDDPIPDVVRADLPFRIVDVTVDKPEVCRGERTVVRVRAEHDEGKVDWLVPSIGGRVGWTVALIVPGEQPGTYKIPVQLGDPDRNAPGTPVDYQQKSAFVLLKDCEAPPTLWLSSKQPSPVEEEVSFRAGFTGKGPQPVSFVWDFGDGSPRTTTRAPEAHHLFPSEEERGPGKRVFTYLVRAEALDRDGKVLAIGSVDLSLRNRLEELKHVDHRLQLLAIFHPHPNTDSDGARFIDVTLKNLDPEETASLTTLEYRLVPCAAEASPRLERHGVTDVFHASAIPPRGSITGRLRSPQDGSADVCNLDVAVQGTSQPSGLTVGATFSMRIRFELGQGVDLVEDPDQAAAVQEAMTRLGKSYVTPEDLARLPR